MHDETPLVVHWDTFEFNCRDVLDRFKKSKFNYFYKNRRDKVLVGFWEAEEGSEVIGEVIGGGTSDEVMMVIEGQLHVSAEGMPEKVAGPGDAVMCLRHRQTRVEVKEKARVLFIVWGMDVDEASSIFEETPKER